MIKYYFATVHFKKERVRYIKYMGRANDKMYFRNRKPHRERGPAISYHYGQKIWYTNGIRNSDW